MVIEFGKIALFVAVAGALVGSVSTLALRKGSMTTRLRRCQGLAWLSAVAAAVCVVVVVLHGSYGVALSVPGSQHSFQLLSADPTTVVLLLLICGVGAVVESFSLRYLQGDERAPVFFGWTGLVLFAMSMVVTASTVVVVTVAWVVVGWSFPRVVGYRKGASAIAKSVRVLRRNFIVGDVALVLAVVLIVERVGDIQLAGGLTMAHDSRLLGSWSTIVALLIVIAALVRSAQLVFSLWLPTTVAAPTPVSALLHAGVVNGGGILLIRFGPLATSSEAAMLVAFVSGTATALAAFVVMRSRADIKGSLVYSTMSQMGFMIAECSVGLPFAALLHLVGHGIYKATLFFRSGTAVPRLGAKTVVAKVHAPKWEVVVQAALATALLSGLVVLVVSILGQHEPGVLLVFVVGSFGVATWNWFNRRPAPIIFTVMWLVALGLVGTLYALVLAALQGWTAMSLPGTSIEVLGPWWLLLLAALGVALTAAFARRNARRWLVHRLGAIGDWAVRDLVDVPYELQTAGDGVGLGQSDSPPILRGEGALVYERGSSKAERGSGQ